MGQNESKDGDSKGYTGEALGGCIGEDSEVTEGREEQNEEQEG